MKRQSFKNDVFQSLLMAALVAAALPEVALAQAAGGGADIGATATTITGYVGTIAPLISALFWLAGAVLMGIGAMKLKEHTENPVNNPLRQGVSRIAVGAALISIPFFGQWAVNTLAAGTAAVGYTPLPVPGGAAAG